MGGSQLSMDIATVHVLKFVGYFCVFDWQENSWGIIFVFVTMATSTRV